MVNEDTQAWRIKLAAMITATPRAVGALLAAEGLHVPSEFMGWWLLLSALAGIGMAVVEGFAFAFMLRAWRNQTGKQGNLLISLAIFSAITFVVVMAPYLAASVRGETLSEFIPSDIMLLFWSSSVALTTISVVMGVGYAQKVSGRTATDPAIAALKTQLRESEQRAKAAEQRAMDAESSANAANARFDAAGDMMRLLIAENKRDRITAARNQWPALPITALAIITGASPSYVSEVLAEHS